MMDDITYSILIAGNPTKLRFDVEAMADIEQNLELMAMGLGGKKSFFTLLDPPYDIREMAVLLMHGINGANRFEKIDNRLNLNDAKALLQKHFFSLMEGVTTAQDFTTKQANFMGEISKAARIGVGFREAVKQPEKQEATPQNQ